MQKAVKKFPRASVALFSLASTMFVRLAPGDGPTAGERYDSP